MSNPSRNAERWIACILPIVGGAGLLVFALVSLAREEGAGEFPMPGSPGAPQDQREEIAAAAPVASTLSEPAVPSPWADLAIDLSRPAFVQDSEEEYRPVDKRLPTLLIRRGGGFKVLRAPETGEEIESLISATRTHPMPLIRGMALSSLSWRLGFRDPTSEWWSNARYDLEVQNLAIEVALQDPDSFARSSAVGVLAQHPSDVAWRTLVARLQADPETQVRQEAVWDLQCYVRDDQWGLLKLYQTWSADRGNPLGGDPAKDELFQEFVKPRRAEASQLLAWAAEHDPDPGVRETAAQGSDR